MHQMKKENKSLQREINEELKYEARLRQRLAEI